MKAKRTSFVGERPIFSGSPNIVPGGFNLERTKQIFSVADRIPAGSLAIFDEQTRIVQILKTAKVKAIDADDAKIITLFTSDYYQPVFAVGDKVLVNVSGLYASAPSITKIEKTDNEYKITLSAAITGLAVNDVLTQVVSKSVASTPVIAGVFSVNTTTLMITPGLNIAANDKVMIYPLSEGALIADAKTVTSYDPISGKLVIGSAFTSIAAGDKIAKVFASSTAAVLTETVALAALIGDANSLTIEEITVREYETAVDVTDDTLGYALFERRVLPIPASQKDATGKYLKANSHIKLSQSF